VYSVRRAVESLKDTPCIYTYIYLRVVYAYIYTGAACRRYWLYRARVFPRSWLTTDKWRHSRGYKRNRKRAAHLKFPSVIVHVWNTPRRLCYVYVYIYIQYVLYGVYACIYINIIYTRPLTHNHVWCAYTRNCRKERNRWETRRFVCVCVGGGAREKRWQLLLIWTRCEAFKAARNNKKKKVLLIFSLLSVSAFRPFISFLYFSSLDEYARYLTLFFFRVSSRRRPKRWRLYARRGCGGVVVVVVVVDPNHYCVVVAGAPYTARAYYYNI